MLETNFFVGSKTNIPGCKIGCCLTAVLASTLSSHPCGLSLTWGSCEVPNSALVGQVVFSGSFGFHPTLINDRLDISEIFLKGQ